MQRTLVLIKPDAFRRNIVAKVMRRIELKGYEVVNMKFWEQAPRHLIETHYEQDKDKPYFKDNCDFMTSGPLLAIVYKGDRAINGIRVLQGNRDTPGSIRGDYVTDVRQNLIHASDSEQSATKEIKIWFP
ncbi:mg473 protein [Tupanvirus deep ocean]|uniref:Mg473 protein n=2 Tax=Tupanvirus TaxID=2094720 RepID=A0AC62A8T3_9VIRU|nr:mg473 protein [Tupanvirus deep ocean]QKU34028.1 mg473 protein [Tupanvirus deep ocean]